MELLEGEWKESYGSGVPELIDELRGVGDYLALNFVYWWRRRGNVADDFWGIENDGAVDSDILSVGIETLEFPISKLPLSCLTCETSTYPCPRRIALL